MKGPDMIFSELNYLVKQLGIQLKIEGLNFLSPLGEAEWDLLRPGRCVTSLRLKVEIRIYFTTTTTLKFVTFISHII